MDCRIVCVSIICIEVVNILIYKTNNPDEGTSLTTGGCDSYMGNSHPFHVCTFFRRRQVLVVRIRDTTGAETLNI
jgi:hypothetical protein